MDSEYQYVGGELELFAEAQKWKKYFSKMMSPDIRGHVLEVGAGLGGTSPFLINDQVTHITMLEPDQENVKRISAQKDLMGIDGDVILGMTTDLKDKKFDTIIYVDVLEHIEYDREELLVAKELLADNGKIIALSPAHQYLFSPFDKAVGHYRRYDKSMIEKTCPDSLRILSNRYLDSVGYFASLANRFCLEQSAPTKAQIKLWDRLFVRCSRWVDPCFSYSFGKSLLTVFEKKGS